MIHSDAGVCGEVAHVGGKASGSVGAGEFYSIVSGRLNGAMPACFGVGGFRGHEELATTGGETGNSRLPHHDEREESE